MPLLFRPEALEAQRSEWLGAVRLVRPPSLAWLTGAVIAVATVVGVFLWQAHYTRKATLHGVLAPDTGLIRLVAAQPGTVLDRRVTEGQSVQAGDVLYVLTLDRGTLESSAQSAVARSLEERKRSLDDASRVQRLLVESRSAALDRRLQALASEQDQIALEAGLQRQRLGLARDALARQEHLQSEQFISPAQVQIKHEELLAVQVQVQALERQRTALGRERAELEGERRSLPLLSRNTQGEISRDLASLARDSAEQDPMRQLVVRAPRAGTVSAVMAEPGQSVSPSSALASLIPEGATLLVQLYAPSSAIGFVRPGQTVRLRYEAFPYQKFGQQTGQVLQVSRVPLAPSELVALALPIAGQSLTAAATAEPLFRITVKVDEAAGPAMPQALVAGMRVQADVLLERRRLAHWLFEPLLGLTERI